MTHSNWHPVDTCRPPLLVQCCSAFNDHLQIKRDKNFTSLAQQQQQQQQMIIIFFFSPFETAESPENRLHTRETQLI